MPAASTPAPSATAGWPSVPGWTVRANKRYISPNGSDSSDGTSPAKAWRSVRSSQIPSNTEVIFLNGTYKVSAASLYSSWSTASGMGNNVTFRSESFRGAVLDGSSAAGGEPLTFFQHERDIEIWGLQFTGWRGVGQVIVGRDVDGFRAIGNKFYNNGKGDSRLHTFYLSHGTSYATAPRNIVVEHNEVNEPGNVGAFWHSWDSAESYVPAHNVTIRYNTVRGTQTWGFILNPNYAGPANTVIANNDIRVSASSAVIDMFPNDPEPGNGVDSTFVVENNILVNLNSSKPVIKRQNITKGAQHQPTLRNNVYWNGGGAALQNIGAGAGDSVKSPQ